MRAAGQIELPQARAAVEESAVIYETVIYETLVGQSAMAFASDLGGHLATLTEVLGAPFQEYPFREENR